MVTTLAAGAGGVAEGGGGRRAEGVERLATRQTGGGRHSCPPPRDSPADMARTGAATAARDERTAARGAPRARASATTVGTRDAARACTHNMQRAATRASRSRGTRQARSPQRHSPRHAARHERAAWWPCARTQVAGPTQSRWLTRSRRRTHLASCCQSFACARRWDRARGRPGPSRPPFTRSAAPPPPRHLSCRTAQHSVSDGCDRALAAGRPQIDTRCAHCRPPAQACTPAARRSPT
jgi:hypothetical protein